MEERQAVETKNQPEGLELMSDYAVVMLPRDAVWLEMTIKVAQDGEIIKVGQKMDFDSIRKAFKDAEDNYLPPDAMFSLTEKGRAELEELKNDPDFEWPASGPIFPLKS